MATITPESITLRTRPRTIRGTYFIQTWGCQMNEEDSEQIALYLQQIGFAPTQEMRDAHVILLNTCSVRKKPEDKAFSLLGELQLLKKRRPEIIVGVCGCMAQIRAKEIRQRNPFVDFVVGTGQIASIPGLVEESAQQRKFQARLELPERKGNIVTDIPQRLVAPRVEGGMPIVPGHTSTEVSSETAKPTKVKAFVPIQYGCDKFCTFCIVPTTRGRERSRPTEDIVAEVRTLAQNGIREVTLLGQTVNSYGKNLAEGRVPFAKLLNILEGIPELQRIRYTSPYPRDFKADLIECIRDNPKVMEHVHLPLQSGDDEMLRTMHRLYSVESFMEIVQQLRDAVPHVGMTTDVIVGYPGETEEQFENTLDVMRQVRFDGAYMFIYSPRPGTPAADMEQLPYSLKQARLAKLMEVQHQITLERNSELVGSTQEVLVEGISPKNPNLLQGYSREYRMVHFESQSLNPENWIGQIAHVEVQSAHLWGLRGKLSD